MVNYKISITILIILYVAYLYGILVMEYSGFTYFLSAIWGILLTTTENNFSLSLFVKTNLQ